MIRIDINTNNFNIKAKQKKSILAALRIFLEDTERLDNIEVKASVNYISRCKTGFDIYRCGNDIFYYTEHISDILGR